MSYVGLPPRSIVVLSCGHQRKVRNKTQHQVFYCLACDEYHPIKAILTNHKDH